MSPKMSTIVYKEQFSRAAEAAYKPFYTLYFKGTTKCV